MSPATVADGRCYHQGNLKADEFFGNVPLGLSAELFDQAFSHDDDAGAQAFASVYLALFPAYCLTLALIRNELPDAARY
jgi:hypothetical protein